MGRQDIPRLKFGDIQIVPIFDFRDEVPRQLCRGSYPLATMESGHRVFFFTLRI